MKPEIENLKAHMRFVKLNSYQKGLALDEFYKLIDYVTELEKLNVDKLLDDFHEWIELNEWEFCPVSFNGEIKYRWSNETYSQATTKELYDIFLSQK
jgi:hypothetical protein